MTCSFPASLIADLGQILHQQHEHEHFLQQGRRTDIKTFSIKSYIY